MPDGFDSGDSFNEAPEAPQETSPFVTDEDQAGATALPSSYRGGLDSYVSKLERQRDQKLAESFQSPVFNVNGQLSRTPPPQENAEWIPLGGPERYRAGYMESKVPIQTQIANQIDAKIPRLPDGTKLSDEHIFQNKDSILSGIMQNEKGNSSVKSFLENPYWDQFKGLDPEALNSFKASVYKNVYRPAALQKQATQGLLNEYTDIYKTDNGKMMYDVLPQEAKSEITNVLTGKSKNFKFTQGVLKGMQEKQDAINDNEDLFNQLKTSQDPDDQKVFKSLLTTHSGASFNTILNRYSTKLQKDKDYQDKNSKDIQAALGEFQSPRTDAIKDQLDTLNKQNFFKKDPSLLNKYIDQSKKSMDDIEIKDADGNVLGKIPGIKNVVDERGARQEIEKLNARDISNNDILVDDNLHLYHGDQLDTFYQKHIKQDFPDSGINGKGQYVAIPKGKLQNSMGENMVLGAPDMNDTSTLSFAYKDELYVRRDELNKLGVTKDDLKSDAPIMFGKDKDQYLAREATPYKPISITADQFLTDKDSQGNTIYDGDRYATWKPVIDSVRQERNIAQARLKDFIGQIDNTNPTTIPKEFGKAFAAGALNTGAHIAANVNTIYLGLKGLAQHALGDTEGAIKTYNDALGDGTELTKSNADQFISEALSKSKDPNWINNLAKDPNATTGQKLAAWAGGLAENLTEFAVISKGTGSIGALGNIGTKLLGGQKAIKALEAAGEASPGLISAMSKMNTIAKSAIDFSLMGIMKGEVNPSQIEENLATGTLFGAGGAFGKGFTAEGLSVKSLPDLARAASVAASQAGIMGMDYFKKKFEGMSKEDIFKTWQDPEFLANAALTTILPSIGAAHAETFKDSATHGVPMSNTDTEILSKNKLHSDFIDLASKEKLTPEETTKYDELKKQVVQPLDNVTKEELIRNIDPIVDKIKNGEATVEEAVKAKVMTDNLLSEESNVKNDPEVKAKDLRQQEFFNDPAKISDEEHVQWMKDNGYLPEDQKTLSTALTKIKETLGSAESFVKNIDPLRQETSFEIRTAEISDSISKGQPPKIVYDSSIQKGLPEIFVKNTISDHFISDVSQRFSKGESIDSISKDINSKGLEEAGISPESIINRAIEDVSNKEGMEEKDQESKLLDEGKSQDCGWAL